MTLTERAVIEREAYGTATAATSDKLWSGLLASGMLALSYPVIAREKQPQVVTRNVLEATGSFALQTYARHAVEPKETILQRNSHALLEEYDTDYYELPRIEPLQGFKGISLKEYSSSYWTDAVTIKPSETIQQQYSIASFGEVKAFVRRFPFLEELLDSASVVLKECFGEDTNFQLEVSKDPEDENIEELVCYIHTKLEPEDALEKLDAFDEIWFLDNVDKMHGHLIFTLEFDAV